MASDKYPAWAKSAGRPRTAACTAAGLRVPRVLVLAREFGADQVAACYPESASIVVDRRADARRGGIDAQPCSARPSRRAFDASIFGSFARTRNARSRPADVRRRLASAAQSRPSRLVARRLRRLARLTETGTDAEFGIDTVVTGRAEAATSSTCSVGRSPASGCRAGVDAHPSISTRREARRARDADVVRRRRDDHRLRPPLRVLSARSEPARSPSPKSRDHEGGRGERRGQGNVQVSLATEDMFVSAYGRGRLPFFVPEPVRAASTSTAASSRLSGRRAGHVVARDDRAGRWSIPDLIAELSELLLDESPIRLRAVSTHREQRALAPLIGIETGSVRIARRSWPARRCRSISRTGRTSCSTGSRS